MINWKGHLATYLSPNYLAAIKNVVRNPESGWVNMELLDVIIKTRFNVEFSKNGLRDGKTDGEFDLIFSNDYITLEVTGNSWSADLLEIDGKERYDNTSKDG